jgi:hypothetical protein|tara:strand:- start:819 stop:1157 length:339 start_codon:yes stop_codon:yes gene_type:complete
MKNLVCSLLVCCSILFSQNTFNENNPCSDRTITFARKFGVKALPIKDLPRYFKASKICREKGGETLIDQIQINEYNRDFEQSKFMSSWTSTYGMCVTAIIFYFFIGLITVVE